MGEEHRFLPYFSFVKKGFIVVVSAALVLMIMGMFAFAKSESMYTAKHTEVVMRQIGHRLLLHARDSASRVEPVQQIREGQFQISFSKPFAFIPDSLMKIISESFSHAEITGSYIVEMKDSKSRATVFAYEVNPDKGDIVACNGRTMKNGNYLLEINFLKPASNPWYSMIPAFILIAGFTFIIWRSQKKPAESTEDKGDMPSLGIFKFQPSLNQLQEGSNIIALHNNETLALTLFHAQLNETVTREQLLKTIWEDKGLIVMDRNVDVLVSKLRKKLSADPRIKITNVHALGYKMTIDA